MIDILLLETLGIVILTATLAVLAARFIQVPPIVAYLVAGLLLGPWLGLLPTVEHSPGTEAIDLVADAHEQEVLGEQIAVVSEIGIVLLLFLVGLELSLDKIREVGKVAVAAGIGQVVFTASGGTVLAMLLGFNLITSLFLATALTFSSTVVVVKVLDQKGELDSLYGRIAVGIFLVQDLVVIAVLTILAGLGTSGEETLQWQTVAVGIVKAFAGMALLTLLALLASRYVLPRPFSWVSKSNQAVLVWSLAWCLILVGMAELLQLSVEIGAFLAGLSLAQLPAAHDLRRRVHPLMSFFIAVFFVSLGAQMEFGSALQQWWPAVVFSLFVLIGNPLIFMLIIARFGYDRRTCFYTSVTVAQISEFSFIFAALGMRSGYIDASVLSLIAVVGLLTIVASVYMMIYNRQLYEFFDRRGWLELFGAPPPASTSGLHREEVRSGHIIIVGMNALGRQLANKLTARGEQVLAIDTDPRKLAGLTCRTMIGNVDYLSLLLEAGLPEAKLVITCLMIEEVNQLLAYRCQGMGVPVAVHVYDHSVHPHKVGLKPACAFDSKEAADRQIEQQLSQLGVKLA
jgi:Kef-type K+ transport system membrane component KefB